MKIALVSIFPELFESFISCSLIKKAIDKSLLSFSFFQIRDFSSPPHFQVDDTPYGGGPGMVMKAEPLFEAITKAKEALPKAKVILMTPRGAVFNQQGAASIAGEEEIIFVCGRYEGVDERVIELLVDHEISIGDFVIMGGEVASMAVIEAVVRLIPGVIGNDESTRSESFNEGFGSLLEAPQYTRPPEFQGKKVPEVLLGGNHQEIKKWREQRSLELTKERRPELLDKKSN